MRRNPTASLEAARPEDVADLIRIARADDPHAALRQYIESHRGDEVREREVVGPLWAKIRDGADRLAKQVTIRRRRVDAQLAAAVAAATEAGEAEQEAVVKALRARLDRLNVTGCAASLASLAASERCLYVHERERQHSLQQSIVMSDVDYVFDLFSHLRLAPGQITHLIAIGADRIGMLKFLMPGFPDLSGAQTDDAVARLTKEPPPRVNCNNSLVDDHASLREADYPRVAPVETCEVGS